MLRHIMQSQPVSEQDGSCVPVVEHATYTGSDTCEVWSCQDNTGRFAIIAPEGIAYSVTARPRPAMKRPDSPQKAPWMEPYVSSSSTCRASFPITAPSRPSFIITSLLADSFQVRFGNSTTHLPSGDRTEAKLKRPINRPVLRSTTFLPARLFTNSTAPSGVMPPPNAPPAEMNSLVCFAMVFPL